jgi:SPP1 gp7 family putative phage head morphogenesis protein
MLTEHEIKELLTDIFEGQVTPENLPVDLYMAIGSFLEKGLLEGAGGKLASFEGKDLELIQELRTNIYMFSAAKTYEEVRTIGEMLYDNEDKIRPFKEFFEEARKTYDTYNVDYAKTEYNTAVASGQMGVRWNQIMADADILPYLQISVVEDAQTTEICEPLNGITLPIKDPFWDEFYPPNHWNCRSTVLQLDEGNISSKAEVKEATKHADEDMQDVFKMNVGKDGYVFSPEHPYFTNAPKELGRENFGLPLPKND